MLSETSPLLPIGDPLDQVNTFPIFPQVQALETTNFNRLPWQVLIPRTASASFRMEPCKGSAFALIVLLQLRKRQIAWKEQYPNDCYRQWTEAETRARNVKILEDKVSELWKSFLTQHRGPLDLHDVLLTPFILQQGKSRTIRVVDFLVDHDAPSNFVAHPIVSMTMSRLWKYGRPDGNDLPTMFRNILSARAIPCKTHLLDLIFDFGFTVLLFNYVVCPPNWPGSALASVRETCIVIYAFSVLISVRGTNVILSAATLTAFTLSPTTSPEPGESRFYALLCVIFSRLFMYLVLTIIPNPTLLVQHRRSFPPVVFLSQSLIRIVRPLIFFYLPLIVVSCLTFSISISKPLTGSLAYLRAFFAISGFGLPDIGVAPVDTRRIFFLFSVIVWLIVFLSAYILGFSTSMTSSDSLIFSPSTAWDLYTPEIGHIARIRSYRAILAYVDDYPFPPPFNIVELLLVTIPIGLMRLLVNPHLRRATIARPVWNVFVRPLMMILTPFCAFLA